MIKKIFLILLIPVGMAFCDDNILETKKNKYKISYEYRTAMRIIPHGFIDQAKSSISAIYGDDNLIDFERSFHIGDNSYGYLVHKEDDDLHIYLISCSKGNQSFVTVRGICKNGNWKYEVIKLLELSTKALEEFDNNNAKKQK